MGISTPLGYSINNVAGLDPRSEIGLHPLYYEDSLTSYPPKTINDNFISPLTRANRGLYFVGQKFGIRSDKKKKEKCIQFNKNKSINPSTGRPIKRKSKTYSALAKECDDKKKKITKSKCIRFLESSKKINPATGRNIKKDGPTYKMLMKKCKKYLVLSGNISISTGTTGTTNTDSFPDEIFIGKKPNIPQITYPGYSGHQEYSKLPDLPPFSNGPRIYPVYVQPPPSTGVSSGTKYTIQPRIFLSFSGKKFKIGSKAKVNYSGEESIITNIGPKQILLRSRLENKEKRIPLQNFIEFNK